MPSQAPASDKAPETNATPSAESVREVAKATMHATTNTTMIAKAIVRLVVPSLVGIITKPACPIQFTGLFTTRSSEAETAATPNHGKSPPTARAALLAAHSATDLL